MDKKSTQKTRAFVLRTLDYGESDRIITFYTDDLGKLKGIAKGARRSRKRFPNAFEPFSLATIMFSRRGRSSLAFIEAADAIEHYPEIRADLEKTLIASYLIELVDQFTIEGKKGPDLFSLMKDFLDLLTRGRIPGAVERFFEIRLLKCAGYDPVLDRCLNCGIPVDELSSLAFSFTEGGIRCSRCARNGQVLVDLSVGTAKTLLLGKQIGLDKIHRLVLSEQASRESMNLLSGFIRHLLGKNPKSLNVLNEIRNIGL
jgi:DNA repair protein RecO (recombination protein O)